MKIYLFRIILGFGMWFATGSFSLFAQGDGPRAYLLSPKGVTGINVKWLNMDGNLIPAGSAFVPGAQIQADIFPITLFHTFSIGGRFAQAFVMIPPGSSSARTTESLPIFPITTDELSTSGTSDGFIALKVGLKGAPALDLKSFAASEMRFSLFGEFRYWFSGSYDAEKLFNLGTNRGVFQLGLPMAIPLNTIRKRATWFEIAPALQFITPNNDPARSSSAEQIRQKPIFILENHLSHNFTPKFWGVVNLRFQQGGSSSSDGVSDENTITALGGGVGLGYQLLAPLGLEMDYGKVLAGKNDLKGNMLRVSLVFVYAKQSN